MTRVTDGDRNDTDDVVVPNLLFDWGRQPFSLHLENVRQVRLAPRPPRKRALSLVTDDRRRVTIYESRSTAPGEFASFACTIIDRLPETPMTPDFVLGPTRTHWVLAWIGFITFLAIMFRVLWILVTEGVSIFVAAGAPAALVLSMVAAVGGVVFWPIVRSGPPRKVDRARFRERLLAD